MSQIPTAAGVAPGTNITAPVGYNDTGEVIEEVTVTETRLPNWPLYLLIGATLVFIYGELNQ